MKLIICEKPSLALNIAKALGGAQRRDGYFISGNYLITFAFGHLYTLKNVNDYLGSKKKWHEVSLPFIPEEFQYKPREDDGVKKQLKVIKGLTKEHPVTEIINCGDADREGQIIIDTIISQLRLNSPVKRLWLPEQTESTIRREMTNLKSNSSYLNLQREGYARTYLDWLLGINLTRHVSLKRGTLLRVGRVLIPIVKYIYDRDHKIRDFVPEDYHSLISQPTVKLEVKRKFPLDEMTVMKDTKNRLNSHRAIVRDVKKESVKKKPKKLFSLSKLQSEISKKYKINFDTSLKAIQSLYEKGYITYPRTNTEYLAENEVEKMREVAGSYPEINLRVRRVKSIFDDSRVESHSAITITSSRVTETLSPIEDKVYNTVFNRFVSNFLDEDTIVSKTSLTIFVGEEEFILKGEVLEREGFFRYEPQKLVDNLPKLQAGDTFEVDFQEVKKATKPPAKMNESSLASYLKNPFKTEKTTEEEEYKAILQGIEIGTEATRTGIIEKCIGEGYISRSGQIYSIESQGEDLIDTLIKLKVDMFSEKTVEFSKLLKEVYRGTLSLSQLIASTRKELEDILALNTTIEKKGSRDTSREVVGPCPRCGGRVCQGKTSTGKTNYYCENYRNGCEFTLWENMKHYQNNIKITKTKAKSLLKNKDTKFKLKNKGGQDYEAFLRIKLNGKYVNFEVSGFPEKKKPGKK